jgi:hypothetical protein
MGGGGRGKGDWKGWVEGKEEGRGIRMGMGNGNRKGNELSTISVYCVFILVVCPKYYIYTSTYNHGTKFSITRPSAGIQNIISTCLSR